MATGEVLEKLSHEYHGPLALCDGGGGGSSTSSTTYNLKPWHEYVPYSTAEALKKATWSAESRQGKGLTPEEQQYYRGNIISDVAGSTAGAQKALEGRLARSGVTGGAAAEAHGSVAREGLRSRVSGLSKLTGLDLQRKDINFEQLYKLLTVPKGPIVAGSTTETSGGGGGT